MSEPEKVREKIIDAAVERFLHYGYAKTTIAELAADCDMSPGNIYRFFKGKIDIAAEIARREALTTVERMEAVLECPFRNSRQRLEEVVFADMRHTFHMLENQPRVLELAQVVVQERPQFQIESLRRERRIFQRILRDGAQTGEFELDNITHATIAVHSATLKYRYTQLFTNQTLEELERELCYVLTLLVRGLTNKTNQQTLPPTSVPVEAAFDQAV